MAKSTPDKAVNKETKEKKTAAKKSLIIPSQSVTIKLEWSSVEPLYTKTLNKLSRTVKAEGFRIGKAPAAIAEAKIGFETIADQVLQALLPEAYETAIKESGKKPITTPEFNPLSLKKKEAWTLEAHFDIMPEVKLGDYKKVVQSAQKEAAKFIVDRNKAIKEEAAAHERGEHGHTDDHAHTHEPLGEQEEKEIKLQHIFKALVDAAAPGIGEIMLRQETQGEFEQLVNQLKQYKMTTDEYLERRQITIEQLSQELAGSVLSRLQLDFILAAISQDQKLTVDQKEIEAEMQKVTNLQMRAELEKNEQYQNQIKATLLQRKTLDLLLTI